MSPRDPDEPVDKLDLDRDQRVPFTDEDPVHRKGFDEGDRTGGGGEPKDQGNQQRPGRGK